jgi:hypothetical protein
VHGTAVELQLELLLTRYDITELQDYREQLQVYRQRLALEKRHVEEMLASGRSQDAAPQSWVAQRPWFQLWRLGPDAVSGTEVSLRERVRLKSTFPHELSFEEKLARIVLVDL